MLQCPLLLPSTAPGPDRVLEKSLLNTLPRGCLMHPPPCPKRAPSPGWHQELLPLPLAGPKPELAPLGEESGDQLSQLQYHMPPGRLGPALSPRGALSASCPGGPQLCPSPSELLSLGKSESAGDLVGECWSGGPGGGAEVFSAQALTRAGLQRRSGRNNKRTRISPPISEPSQSQGLFCSHIYSCLSMLTGSCRLVSLSC